MVLLLWKPCGKERPSMRGTGGFLCATLPPTPFSCGKDKQSRCFEHFICGHCRKYILDHNSVQHAHLCTHSSAMDFYETRMTLIKYMIL